MRFSLETCAGGIPPPLHLSSRQKMIMREYPLACLPVTIHANGLSDVGVETKSVELTPPREIPTNVHTNCYFSEMNEGKRRGGEVGRKHEGVYMSTDEEIER